MNSSQTNAEWPADHPEWGAPLTRAQVATTVGWINPDNVDVAVSRTRAGTAKVPFPEPAGCAVPPDTTSGYPERFWWRATIEHYRDQLRRFAPRSAVTPGLVAAVRRRIADGERQSQIATDLHLGRATVSRIHTGKIDEEGRRVG